MSDVDEKWDQLLGLMRALPPVRNVNAIRAWMTVYKPGFDQVFDMLCRDAAKGVSAPKRIVMFMMMAFAAGRAYQVANPDAQRDPDGYGG